MRQLRISANFESWRDAARQLLADRVPPSEIVWSDDRQTEMLPMDETSRISDDPSVGATHASPAYSESSTSLFGGEAHTEAATPASRSPRVPPAFVETARIVACHRDPQRWSLLYRLLWRLTHGEHGLLDIASDDDVRMFMQMEKAVRRDRHKMTAFVRFKEVQRDGQTHYVAWYRPDHYVVRLAADHFQQRYHVMNWSILTPDDCVHWDGESLTFTPGVSRDQAPQPDELESLWLTYYGSIFNPARIKLGAMRKEMPVRFWGDLPEAAIIPDLLQQAPARVDEMIRRSAALAAESNMTTVPETTSLKVLREAAAICTRCPLYKNATQTVFGEGPKGAEVVFVGEQPGDQEDLAGRPFVGPAGKLMDDVLDELGIDRSRIYVTNAVKHFKFEPRGTRRIHAKPNAREMAACHVWIEQELQIIKPQALVLLGATAAQSLVGRTFRITKQRGQPFESEWSPWTLATWHPSALLRAPDEEMRKMMRDEFKEDLAKVAKRLRTLTK
jgi:DNA polymerase